MYNYNDLIANSNTTFGSGQFDIALTNAKQAISAKPKKSEGYYCAGKACMSMDEPQEAVGYFQKATGIDKNNGNGFFLLGYAQILANQTVDAIQSLTFSSKSS